MHAAVGALLQSLSFGSGRSEKGKEGTEGAVARLARVYEIARNALEYRADHLVRRAAIERILRRQLVFGAPAGEVAKQLLTELKWAMYVTEVEEEKISKKELEGIMGRYAQAWREGWVDRDWLVGMASAEIEDLLNPNNDYHQFTAFAYHALGRRVELAGVDHPELVVFVAVDRVYSDSDTQQISYHLYRLIRGQAKRGEMTDERRILEETWRHFHAAMTSPVLNRLMAWMRRQMGPMVLLRDMYFANPAGFSEVIADQRRFGQEAAQVLGAQLALMGGRIRTATVRSLIYVFLTKMLVVFLVELPLERAIVGHVNYVVTGVNVLIPVLFMWLLVSTVKLPGRLEQERLLGRAWSAVAEFDSDVPEGERLVLGKERSRWRFILYYLFYGLLFMVTFALIVMVLTWVRFNFASIIVFLFFLCVVSFFAYRIRQTAQVYAYKPRQGRRSSISEAVLLPIVIVGGVLSSGVARLNFLVFVFDFVLEAPYKMLLKFLDNWLAFLAARKDEAVG